MKKIAILILMVMVILITWQINSFYQDKENENIIKEIENYKANNGAFPLSLNQLNIKFPEELHYSSDSIRQTFSLSYSKGIMNSNTMMYTSETKKWKLRFNY
jgi:hypothetical protein